MDGNKEVTFLYCQFSLFYLLTSTLKIVCYYFDDIIKIENLDLDILIDEKSYKNILLFNISCKTLIDAKSLHIRFNNIDGFMRVCDGTRYLVLFGSEKYDFIYNRIRYIL